MTLPSHYPVVVAPDSPVLNGLTAFELNSDEGKYDPRGRRTQLPCIYEWKGPHPSHPVKFKESRTYVYLVDPSLEGKEVAQKLWMDEKVPGGPVAGT